MRNKKKILATSWHPGGANAITPVIKLLIKEKKTSVVVVGYEFSEKIFQEADIDYKTIGSYGLKNVSVDSMKKLLQIESPDLVLTGTSVQNNDNRDIIEQTLTLAAKRKGVKSLAVSDWWIADVRFNDICTNEKLKFLPDKIAIMDKLAEETMIKEGIPRGRLVITGNPYFDSLAELKEKFQEEDKKKVRADLGVDLDAYLILFASQPIEKHYGQSMGYTEKTALRELLESLGKIKTKTKRKICVLVKIHPRENRVKLEKITKEYDLSIIVDKSYSTKLAVLASDVVISPFSTVLIESSYLDKPSISLQPGLKVDDLLITNQLGVTVPVCKHGEIGAILEKLLFNEEYIEKLSRKRKDFKVDGKATQRVKKLIYNMLKM